MASRGPVTAMINGMEGGNEDAARMLRERGSIGLALSAGMQMLAIGYVPVR